MPFQRRAIPVTRRPHEFGSRGTPGDRPSPSPRQPRQSAARWITPWAPLKIRTRKATRKAWFTRGRLNPESTLVPLLRTAIDWALEEPNARALGIISVLPVELVLRYATGAWDSSHEQTWKSMKQPRSLLDAFSKALAPILERWPGTLLTAHYGATRGLDDMAQVDALITLGDPWGNLNAAKNTTGYLSCEYEWERRYADCCRAELEQAHGRLRTVHRTRPGRALHVGAVMPGGPKWASDRVSVRELPPRWPLEMSELSSEQFAVMVKRLGGIRAVGRLIGCGHTTVARYASGVRVPPADVTRKLQHAVEGQSSVSTCEPECTP